MIDSLKQQAKTPIILDIGCGDKTLQSLFHGAKYLGIDVTSDSSADFILNCNIDNPPFADKSIDAVIMTNSLEHIFNTKHILDEIRRVILPDGLFYFSVPMTYPRHAHPDDYIRFTPYYFKRAFADWRTIRLQTSNSIFSTPFLLTGQIFSMFFPNWLTLIPITLINSLTVSLVDPEEQVTI